MWPFAPIALLYALPNVFGQSSTEWHGEDREKTDLSRARF